MFTDPLFFLLALVVAVLALALLMLFCFARLGQRMTLGLAEQQRAASEALREQRQELGQQFGSLSTLLTQPVAQLMDWQRERMDDFARQMAEAAAQQAQRAQLFQDALRQSITDLGGGLGTGLADATAQQRDKLDAFARQLHLLTAAHDEQQTRLREMMQQRLDLLRRENTEELSKMRETVDEKLQGTLEKRLGDSFSQVNDSLKNVYASVGEMQALATGVGDLKKMLSNVKARGNWGEVVLGNLLEEVLTPDQYAANVEVRPGSRQIVEYAVKLPGDADQDTPLWLPIDAKYPQEDYERLLVAAEAGDSAAVEQAAKALERSIKNSAREIGDKYVAPPHSTDFGVMFLPTESLFAEVARRPGLINAVQNEHRILITGPTNLMALLTSLRMGFRTLAIQKKSGEVWQILGAVKTEFGKFADMLGKVEKKLQEAQNVVADARSRSKAVTRKLKSVEALDAGDSVRLLQLQEQDEPILLSLVRDDDG
jgi:DNA recombination protein RmuC